MSTIRTALALICVCACWEARAAAGAPNRPGGASAQAPPPEVTLLVRAPGVVLETLFWHSGFVVWSKRPANGGARLDGNDLLDPGEVSQLLQQRPAGFQQLPGDLYSPQLRQDGLTLELTSLGHTVVIRPTVGLPVADPALLTFAETLQRTSDLVLGRELVRFVCSEQQYKSERPISGITLPASAKKAPRKYYQPNSERRRILSP
jgi:hypothetical protein